MTHVRPGPEEPRAAPLRATSPHITVRSFVLLTGGTRATSLAAQVGRSVLDLPLSDTERLLDVWRERIAEFADVAGSRFPDPMVQVLAGSSTALPASVTSHDGCQFRARRDASRYRGTAGVLRDLAEQFEDDDFLLVGTASQCPNEGQIPSLLRAADARDGVTLSADARGTPTGLMLVRCEALRPVPEIGFVDLKEQALMRIAVDTGVRVVEAPGRVSRPVRTPRSYLDAVRSWHRSRSLCGVYASNPYEERWRPAFSIVEPGASIGAAVRLHDSVVLAGATVEAGCEVVRSVVGAQGRVRRNERILEQLVLPKGAMSKSHREDAS